MMEFLDHLLALYLDAAPWLLLGLIAAGLIRAFLPEERLSRWLGGRGPWPVVKAALLGAPLPLCSCGVLPAALGLRRAGASRGATVSFLIATPETGPDSIALSYALLGPFLAVVRPIAAVLSAVATGLLTLWTAAGQTAARALPVVACSGACCGDGGERTAPRGPAAKARQGLGYAFSDILDDLVPWLVAGLVLAAVVATLVPPLMMAEWGSGPAAKLLMLVVGVPMYVCATASTPIAAGLLVAGISPGTVLVFLLAGPATNLATVAVIRKEMGGGTAATYLAGIALTSLLAGTATDRLAATLDIDILAQLGSGGEVLPGWLAALSGAVLLLFAIKPLRRLVFRG